MRELIARLRDWLHRDRLDAELSEELRFHRSLLERDAQSGGATPDQADRAARRRLGNLTRIHERARAVWSVPWLDHLQQDVRYAARGLRRSPGFTAAIVLTLGLGIGANAAMFTVVDELMFRPHAFLRDPASVHRVYLRMPGAQRLLTRESFPYSRYLDLREFTTSFSEYAAFFPTTVAVGTGESARERPIAAVSASYFGFFDARPAVGRFFEASEDTTPVGARVAVLSFAFWQTELGGRSVIGESIRIGTIECTIIGIAPRGFTGVADGAAPTAFIPITTFGGNAPGGSSVGYWMNYRWDWTEMMVRRKPGVSPADANADLTLAYIRSRDAARAISPWMPRTDATRPVAIAGALKAASGPYPGLEARTLLWVTGVAAIVLLIACANVANLFLARALRRQRETALRVALGVTRWRLTAQSLTESLVLSMLGCVVGIAIAQWGGTALRRLVLPDTAPLTLATDWRTLLVAIGAAVAAGLLTGIAPVLLAGRSGITGALNTGVRGGMHRRSRLRASLLVVQGALSVALLVGAGLFVRSLDRVRGVDLGYDVDPILMVKWERRGAAVDAVAAEALRQRLLDVAREIPGVERAAWASNVPLQGTSTMGLFVPGIDSIARLGRFTYQVAGSDYFAVMGTRILRGRAFTDADRADAPPVVVVSEEAARVIWPQTNPIGQCMRIGSDTVPCSTVVGVAENAVHDPVQDQPMRYYLPLLQRPSEGSSLLVLRMRGRPAEMAEGVRRALQPVMPGQQYVTVRPMAGLLDQRRRSWQVGATMFVAFGMLALAVAAVGLYGVIAYDVAQRKHEIGVRVALGAREGDILGLVVTQSVRLAIAGVAVGVIVALAASRWIQPLLFRQSATDPVVYGIVGAIMLIVALAASALPAFRAARTDPNIALRVE